MPRVPSRLLVIDASVARAAGFSEQAVSSATRQFLNSVLDICHRMALTEPIREEWRRHQSKFTERWRLSMYARRKIVLLPNNEDAGLTARLQNANQPQDRQSTLKDIPLILAARQADGIVVSRDDNARMLFQVRELRDIMWVNPVPEPDRVKEWLEDGAPEVEEWKLRGR